ncbi:hypothetical protein K5I29_05305 [Flavobacterium agricola]|uniref:DUF3976 domain-containing protein n=1 Tax=Flavobacterium agricola TaxID=2870839 RepID=A0ABY6M182_9FLAO|nr:hypothetical protein [Flavobacterium agricola]UYW02317.1 hypothetical protein K5I29_05305 [Flavobacterium agricola]
MNFTSGQITFGIIFAICFTLAIIFMYRKDLKIHNAYYKGTKWIVLAFLGFIALLFLIKVFLKQ